MDSSTCFRIQIGRIGNIEEWAMVEFQGIFIVKDSALHKSVSEGNWASPSVVDLGQLTIDGTNATLAVGNNILKGNIIDLHTPMLICEKLEPNKDPIKGIIQQHKVVGYLKKKIIFSTRPKTV